jgi:hypothetical protein
VGYNVTRDLGCNPPSPLYSACSHCLVLGVAHPASDVRDIALYQVPYILLTQQRLSLLIAVTPKPFRDALLSVKRDGVHSGFQTLCRMVLKRHCNETPVSIFIDSDWMLHWFAERYIKQDRAKTTMALYCMCANDWERSISLGRWPCVPTTSYHGGLFD